MKEKNTESAQWVVRNEKHLSIKVVQQITKHWTNYTWETYGKLREYTQREISESFLKLQIRSKVRAIAQGGEGSINHALMNLEVEQKLFKDASVLNEETIEAVVSEKIREILDLLPIRHQEVIQKIFFERETLATTARYFGISSCATAKILNGALKNVEFALKPGSEIQMKSLVRKQNQFDQVASEIEIAVFKGIFLHEKSKRQLAEELQVTTKTIRLCAKRAILKYLKIYEQHFR
jgi:DNA-directed RNA polymerase specialized sigma24 family protein